MRISSLLLYACVIAALGVAFACGHYIGRHDATKHYDSTMKLAAFDQSVQTLRITGKALDLLQGDRLPDAKRLLSTYARIQVPSVRECLALKGCTAWVAPSDESLAELSRYAASFEPLSK